MAAFFANRIIRGNTTYAKVPASLKEAVAKILTQKGHENLIKSEE